MPRNWLDYLNIPAQWPHTKGAVRVAVLDNRPGEQYATPVNYTGAHFHGQGCAYIIKSIAPDADVYGINVVGLALWRMADALRWCTTSNIDLINLSVMYNPSDDDLKAMNDAAHSDIIIVAAAGNTDGGEVSWPGRDSSAIAVTAYWPDTGRIANTAAAGPEVFIASPTGAEVPTPAGGWMPLDETSGAAPHITGCLALYIERFRQVNGRKPTLNECRAFLRENAQDILLPGRDEKSGYGLFKFPDPDTWPKEVVDVSLLNYDLRTASRVAPEALDGYTKGTALAGTGAAFVAAEDKYGVNARYLLAHAIHESGWGKSRIAQEKNNLFGFQAYDSSPYVSAKIFVSFAECIDYVARYIAVNYLTSGGKYFNGPTLAGMNVRYATDPDWGKKIASIMAQIPEEPKRGDILDDYKGRWSEVDIAKAIQYGLMNGYPDGTFKPEQPVTREELAAVAVRIYEKTKNV